MQDTETAAISKWRVALAETGLRGLAGTPQPPADPIFRDGSFLETARLLSSADGVTLNALKLAALALKRGDEAEARRLLERAAP